MRRQIVILALLTLSSAGWAEIPSLSAILAGEHRSAEHRTRDSYRHPAETLAFFELAAEGRNA